MTRLFISFAREDLACVQQLRAELGLKGYTVWQDPGYSDPASASYAPMIENAILSSAAVLLVWSQSASQHSWVERQILFAQRLKKLLFPILLDTTPLPHTLLVSSVPPQGTCSSAVPSLLAQPDFPPAQSTDPYLLLCEQAAHDYVRERKAAIDRATEMLQQGLHRKEVLALLEYLAQNDVMFGVREKAEEALKAAQPRTVSPLAALSANESRHIFGVRCKNGHVSYFDKRRVCPAHTQFTRGLVQSAGKELDEIHLKCDTCGEEVVARVDCGGYK